MWRVRSDSGRSARGTTSALRHHQHHSPKDSGDAASLHQTLKSPTRLSVDGQFGATREQCRRHASCVGTPVMPAKARRSEARKNRLETVAFGVYVSPPHDPKSPRSPRHVYASMMRPALLSPTIISGTAGIFPVSSLEYTGCPLNVISNAPVIAAC